MREPQGSREDSAPDAHLINFLPDPNAGIGGMIYVYASRCIENPIFFAFLPGVWFLLR